MSDHILIIVLTYNRVNWLKDCLQSFLSQTYQNFRLVVLDNASDQDVEGMIHKFEDPRITLIRNETNLGIFGNFEKAWEMADDDFFMIFHDDDCAHPRLIESQIQIFRENPSLAFVATGCNLIYDHTKMMLFHNTGSNFSYEVFEDHRELVRGYLSGRPFGFCSTMYRTSILKGTRSLRESLTERFSLCADRPLLVSLSQNGPCAYLTRPTYNVRVHQSQDSKRIGLETHYSRETLRFYRETLNDAWDAGTARSFEKAATINLISTYMAWLRSSPATLPMVFKDLAKQDLIHPLTFLRWGAKIAGKAIRKRANKLFILQ